MSTAENGRPIAAEAYDGERFARTTVIVVDVQNDFCSPAGALHREGTDTAPAEAVVEPINRLTSAVRAAGGSVVFLQSIYTDESGRFLLPGMRAQALRRWKGRGVEYPFLQEGSWGAELHPKLDVRADVGDQVVRKRSPNGFYRSALGTTLRTLRAQTVLVTGVTSDCCVLFTAEEAYQRGFSVVVPAECVAAYDAVHHASALDVLDWVIGRVIPLHDILSASKADARKEGTS